MISLNTYWADSDMIFANGCSHTAGSESVRGYVDFIGEAIKLPVTNISAPGGSNHKILRTSLQWLETNPVPDLVIIGWSTHERFEFSFDGAVHDYTLDKRSTVESLETFYRYSDLHLADWNFGLENTLTYQLCLQNYLEKRNISYIYCNMFNSVPKDCQHPVWHALDKNKYYMPHSSLIEKYLGIMPDHFSPTKHADAVVHKYIANELLGFMQKQES